MKNKNPLYVVKGKDIEEVSSLLDLVIKKFNLGPALNVLKNIFTLLLEQVENFAAFKVVKDFLDQLLSQVQAVIVKFQGAARTV
jgi:hypothetical protein